MGTGQRARSQGRECPAGGDGPMNAWQAASSNPETEQAKRVLAWLDQWLPATLDKAAQAVYWRARQLTGQAATTNRARPYPGAPYMPGPRLPVSGGGDDAY